MNDTNIHQEIPNYILAQAPVLLACLGSLIVALRFWRKAPGASLWAAGAFALALFTSVLVGVGQAVGSDATTHFIGPVLRGTTYVLLLIGVYAGRTSPSVAGAGSPVFIWQNAISTVRARPGLLAVSRVLFVGVFLVVVITTTLVTFILPESFVSQARIALRPNATNPAGTTGLPGASAILDPRSVQTECEVIRSEGILGKVIEDLDLNKEWGKKYADGDWLKTSETMALLRGRLDLRPVPNTSIIEIRIYSEKPEEAAKVANALAEAYRDHSTHADPATSMSNAPRIEILDHAVPGFRPVRPNKPLNITLGVLIGLVLGLLAGAGAWWVWLKVERKPGANPQS